MPDRHKNGLNCFVLSPAGIQHRMNKMYRQVKQERDCIYSLPDLESYGAGFSIKLKSGTQIDLGFHTGSILA